MTVVYERPAPKFDVGDWVTYGDGKTPRLVQGRVWSVDDGDWVYFALDGNHASVMTVEANLHSAPNAPTVFDPDAERTYYFEQGHSNAWNIYLRMPGMPCDKFVCVVFDSYLARVLVGCLNTWSKVKNLDDDALWDLVDCLPDAARKSP